MPLNVNKQGLKMRSSRLSKSPLIFTAAILNALALVGTVFDAIADAPGSRVALPVWAMVFGVSMLLILGYLAVERDP